MTLRFDHAVIAVRDLEAAAETYRTLGFTVQSGGRHTGKGTRNALIRFPDDYLELLAVDDREEALAAGPSRRDLVRFIDEQGAGFATFALRTGDPDELDRLAERWRDSGIEVAGPNPAERRRPDGSVLRWRTAVPGTSSFRRPWPFLIEWPGGALEGAPPPGSHANAALGVGEVAVGDADVSAFDVLERLGLPTEARSDDDLPGAARRTVRLPGVDLDVVVPRETGPFQLGIRVADLAALRDTLAARGLGPEAAWPAGFRLATAPPEASMLVFLPDERRIGA